MILHIPHASRVIPAAERRDLLLDDAGLAREVLRMTDHDTDELFGAHAGPKDEVVRFPVSRLVVDPERFCVDAEEPMADLGMGAVYTSTSDLQPLRDTPTTREREQLLNRWYHPHHRRLLDAVNAELARDGHALVVDCHSFPSRALPYEDEALRRPEICIGTDPFHTPPTLLDALVTAVPDHGLSVAVNEPFAGALVPASLYRRDRRVAAVMIEVNRMLYMEEDTGRRSSGFETTQQLLGELLLTLQQAMTEWLRSDDGR